MALQKCSQRQCWLSAKFTLKKGVLHEEETFAVEQIAGVLKEAEAGMPVAELIRRIGIAEQTFYRWKKQCAGLVGDQER